MLHVLGSPRRLCDGLRRRDFLQVGGLGLFGIGLAHALSAGEFHTCRIRTGGLKCWGRDDPSDRGTAAFVLTDTNDFTSRSALGPWPLSLS